MSEGLANTSVNQDMLWWIGQIADDSTWRDNQLSGKFKNAQSIPGWGCRYKVRIMGVHDHGGKDSDPIPEDQLPWANIMYPVTAGGGQGGSNVTPNLRQGNIVWGYWMDGKDMQVPVIMGVLGNNSQTALGKSIGKVEEEGVTNTQNGQIGKSGWPNKQEVPKPNARKAKVPKKSLITHKPTSQDIAKEAAAALGGVGLDKFGLNSALEKTTNQLNDIASATFDAESLGLDGGNALEFIKGKVQEAKKNRVGVAESPLTPPEKGAEIESADNPHQLTADDVEANDLASECIVTPLQQEDVVTAATKRIQIETDNLTAKIDKMLGARKNYIDAVSGPPSAEEIQKEVKVTAEKISKFQKIIMDKVGEYQNKKMNLELTKVVAAMPSSMRFMFADQKFLNTQSATQKYNEITNGMASQMEGILTAKLDIASLIKKADKEATSGVLWADPTSQSAVAGILDLGGGEESSGGGTSGGDVTQVNIPDPDKPRTPKVPMCYAEDLVAQGIAVNKDKLSKIAESQHRNYNRFLEGVKSQLEKTDQEIKDKAPNMSNVGKVTSITDEEEDDLPQGGTNYYTETGAPVTGGSGTGFKVDIIVSTGGWYDNGFATINDEGAGYYVDTANGGGVSGTGTTTGISATGGSGSGLKLNFTIASGKITGISTNTVGSNYKDGDVLTISQGSQAAINPTTYATFTIDKVRGTVETVANGGIKIADPGRGYKIGELLVVNQQGSGENCGVVITQVFDLGQKKATAGPVTPGDIEGAVGQWVPPKASSKPNVGDMLGKAQQLGDMLNMLGGMQGSMTQAFDFKNLMGNIFPFEPPPNSAVSDCYTLAQGGKGVPEVNKPTPSAIDKAISKVKDVAPSIENLDFATPSLGTPSIDLKSVAQDMASSAQNMVADVDDAWDAAQSQVDEALDIF